MASVLSSSGLASGIDTKGIVDALIKADRQSTVVLEKNKTTSQTRLDTLTALRTKLLAAQDAIDILRKSDTYTGTKATSSNTNALAASGTTATAGTYLVSVKQLAQSHQLITGGPDVGGTPLASKTDNNGNGSITIKIGSGAETVLNFNTTNSSVDGIASAVNAAKLGVTASVVNDGAGYRLVLQSDKSGTANAITKFNGSGDLATLLPSDGSGNTTLRELAAAKDAQLRIGDPTTGLLVTKSSNTVTDVIPGVTLTLKDKADSITVDVTRDSQATKDKIKAFVTAMNSAVSHFTSNASFDAISKKAGALLADSDLRSSLNSITSGLFESVAGQPEGYGSLANLGISIDQKTGQLSFNETTFDAAYAANPSATQTLFTSASDTAKNRLNNMTDATLGQIYFKTDSLKDSITRMTEQITKADERLALRRKRYEAEFLQMEKLIQSSKDQGNSLNNFISSLSKKSE
jgi:flagellar hook-associated protein 2